MLMLKIVLCQVPIVQCRVLWMMLRQGGASQNLNMSLMVSSPLWL